MHTHGLIWGNCKAYDMLLHSVYIVITDTHTHINWNEYTAEPLCKGHAGTWKLPYIIIEVFYIQRLNYTRKHHIETTSFIEICPLFGMSFIRNSTVYTKRDQFGPTYLLSFYSMITDKSLLTLVSFHAIRSLHNNTHSADSPVTIGDSSGFHKSGLTHRLPFGTSRSRDTRTTNIPGVTGETLLRERSK